MASPPDLTIRTATKADIPGIVALINAAFQVEKFFIDRDRIDMTEVTRLVETGAFLIAHKAQKQPCACVYVEPRGERLYVGLLSVDPAHQHKGLGALIMAKAEDYGRALALHAVDIRVVNLRTELPRFYERLGYVACGTEPFVGNAAPNLPCHFILMTKRLSEAAEVVREIARGAVHVPGRLSLDEQRAIVDRCFELGRDAAGFYTPVVRGNHPMSVRMLCLGRHWNARTYSYDSVRADVDGLPVPQLPREFAQLANRIARDAGFALDADLCIVNWYSTASRMGLHQDKDESRESIDSGVPVVSVSIGDTARFLFGGLRRRDPVETLMLGSGDAFVFGGPSRLRYHGVSRIIPGTGPALLGFDGRLNLTFRRF